MKLGNESHRIWNGINRRNKMKKMNYKSVALSVLLSLSIVCPNISLATAGSDASNEARENKLTEIRLNTENELMDKYGAEISQLLWQEQKKLTKLLLPNGEKTESQAQPDLDLLKDYVSFYVNNKGKSENLPPSLSNSAFISEVHNFIKHISSFDKERKYALIRIFSNYIRITGDQSVKKNNETLFIMGAIAGITAFCMFIIDEREGRVQYYFAAAGAAAAYYFIKQVQKINSNEIEFKSARQFAFQSRYVFMGQLDAIRDSLIDSIIADKLRAELAQ
jgi:hypothetical protein